MTTIDIGINGPYIGKALEIINDPSRSISRPLIRGGRPGMWSLVNAVFPPNGLHEYLMPARYTFTMEGWVTCEIRLMVYQFSRPTQSSSYSLIGMIDRKQWDEIRKVIPIPSDWTPQTIGVTSTPGDGWVYIPKETYRVLEILKSSDILAAREHARAERGPSKM